MPDMVLTEEHPTTTRMTKDLALVTLGMSNKNRQLARELDRIEVKREVGARKRQLAEERWAMEIFMENKMREENNNSQDQKGNKTRIQAVEFARRRLAQLEKEDEKVYTYVLPPRAHSNQIKTFDDGKD